MKLNALLILFFLSIFFNSFIFPQEKNIIIIAESKKIPADETIHITGNNNELGYWNTMQPMKKISSSRWKYEFNSGIGDSIKFKFNRGDWTSEAVDSNGIEFFNFTHYVTKDTTLYYSIPGWRDQIRHKVIVSKERIVNKGGYIELFEGWKYKTGDDTLWADPLFDDNSWKSINNPFLNKKDFEKLESKWTGNAWFRNHIVVDSALQNTTFGFSFFNTGAAEVYLDGKLLYKFGEVGYSAQTEKAYFDRTPKHIIFDGKNEHLIAVRYSNFSAKEQLRYEVPVGFNATLGNPDIVVSNRIGQVRELTINQMAFGTFLLAFAIMHLLLFIFDTKAKENLYYSISMLSFAVVVYTSMQPAFTTSVQSTINVGIINSISVQLSMLFGLFTVYASSNSKMPKQYIIFALISVLFICQTVFISPVLGGDYIDIAYYIFAIIITIEIFRNMIKSIFRKDSWGWGWMIGAGFIVAILFITYQLLIIFNIVRPLFGIQFVYVYGIVFLAITVSINLSKRISDTNKNLEKQLNQVKELSEKTIEHERKAKDEEITRKLLEADNTRKTKELDEARKLQYSMLPRELPPVPGLDIAVYMNPATEVGGDYYDFKYNNGNLTIAVGDATGHGMKAGTLAATLKGLFTAEPAETDILSFFNKCNSIIKNMQLGNLYMAMLLVKIDNSLQRKVSISSAGMPPALIYRENTKQVEEFRIQGLPLGVSSNCQYTEKQTYLSPGDTMLLMSDGFPELFNRKKEILDYDKSKEIFRSVAVLPSKKIIESLIETANDWMDGAEQQDDITFVVVKFK